MESVDPVWKLEISRGMNSRIVFDLERLENWGRGPLLEKWVLQHTYSLANESLAREYCAGANEKHPGVWRLVRVEETLKTVKYRTIQEWSLDNWATVHRETEEWTNDEWIRTSREVL